MSAVNVTIKRLPHADGIELPTYATPGSAGLDVGAAIAADMVIASGERVAVPTGLCLELPAGYEAQLRPRSGLALKQGITVLNSPGTIDSDYRGEIQIILINHGDRPVTVKRGERIAQLVVAPVSRANWIEASDIDVTERGSRGFGSTGTAALNTS
jgi:dUTP pyrophosphatase